jgi:hypothetical protein
LLASRQLEARFFEPLVVQDEADDDGAVFATTYNNRTPRELCRTDLVLDEFIDSAPYVCGLSQNMLLLTKTSLWSVAGSLMCAIG